MAYTELRDGRVVRRSKLMSKGQAQAFARALEHNSRMQMRNIIIRSERGRARVEYEPMSEATIRRFLDEEQQKRRERGDSVKQYKWRRLAYRRWMCTKSDGTFYVQRLDAPHCTCPDWASAHKAGIECKHMVMAREAEKRFEQHRKEREEHAT